MQQEITRQHSTNYHTEQALLYTAIKRWFWKKQGPQYIIALISSILILFFAVKISLMKHNDIIIFLSGVLFAIIYILFAYIIGVWNNIKKQASKISSIETTIFFTEEFLEVITQDGTSKVKWNSFNEIWIFPDVTLLFWRNSIGVFNSIPTQAMSGEMQAFLIKKIEANGGKVVLESYKKKY
jgi:hypothetical protein